MALFGNYLWYGVCENSIEYPVLKRPHLFLIKNNRISKYWTYLNRDKTSPYSSSAILTFAEWTDDDYFYDSLTEGYEKEVKIFTEYKAKMDLEFPDLLISDRAEAIDEEWLLCPFCIHAWQPNSKDGMVICPQCNKKLHNPFYR